MYFTGFGLLDEEDNLDIEKQRDNGAIFVSQNCGNMPYIWFVCKVSSCNLLPSSLVRENARLQPNSDSDCHRSALKLPNKPLKSGL